VLTRIRGQNYDVVFHLAAVPRVSYSVEHPLETNDTNLTKTLVLIDACRGNVGRFVFASSSSVYGGASLLPTPETHPKSPKSPYALQKSVVEEYLKLYNEFYKLDSASLRFFNVFGPNQLGSSPYACALSAWLSKIMKNQKMRCDGDGTQARDLCYVDNVTDCCVRAAQKSDKLNAECFNVACGESTTNREILLYLCKRFPDAKICVVPERPGDVKFTLADISKAREMLGYEPLVLPWDGIERTVKWYQENWTWIKVLYAKL